MANTAQAYPAAADFFDFDDARRARRVVACWRFTAGGSSRSGRVIVTADAAPGCVGFASHSSVNEVQFPLVLSGVEGDVLEGSAEGRRYVGLDVLARAQAVPGTAEVTEREPRARTV